MTNIYVKIMIFNTTLLRQQPGLAETKDRPPILRGQSKWAGGIYG